jgi:putative endonuclease
MTYPTLVAPGPILLRAERWATLQLRTVTRRHSKLPPHLQVGLRGEFEAFFHLRRLHFHIVARRWRSPELNGDLDLIAWEGETLCIVEVKTRSARDMTPAALAIDEPKREMLRQMARSYIRTLPRRYRDGLLLRFDIVSVYLLGERVECEIVRDAFGRSAPRPWSESASPGV